MSLNIYKMNTNMNITRKTNMHKTFNGNLQIQQNEGIITILPQQKHCCSNKDCNHNLADIETPLHKIYYQWMWVKKNTKKKDKLKSKL